MIEVMRRLFLLLMILPLISCSSPEVEPLEEGIESIEPLEQEEPVDDFKLTRVFDVSSVKSSEVLSFICELIMAKPSEATPYCADFGIAVWNIKWSTWQASGATGKGTYRTNDCDPNCADGTIYSAPVDVKLEGLYTDGKRYFLRNLTFTSKETLPLSDTNAGTWDVAKFYIETPYMRDDN